LSQLTAALASATSTSTPVANQKSKNETPALVGGIVGAIFVVGISVGGAYYWYRRKQKRQQEMKSSRTKLVPSISTSNPSTYFEQKYARSTPTPSPSYMTPYATPIHSPNPTQQSFPWSPSTYKYDMNRSTSALTSHTTKSERHASNFTQHTMARSQVYGFDQPGEDIPIAFDQGRTSVKWNEAYVTGGPRSQTPLSQEAISQTNHAVELESRTWTPPLPPKMPDLVRAASPGSQLRSNAGSPQPPQREVRRRVSSSVYTASVYSAHDSVYELDANPPSLPSTSVLGTLVKEKLAEPPE